MIHCLKIGEGFWDLIADRQKKREVRRLNKNHIQRGDRIVYLDMECKTVKGIVVVTGKTQVETEKIIKGSIPGIDKTTQAFVGLHYLDDKEVLVFDIEPIIINEVGEVAN